MVRFVCENCGSEIDQEINCHGHKIKYRKDTEKFVCTDCTDRTLSDREIEECVPKCCHKPMLPGR